VRAHLLLGWAFSTSPLLHGQELGNQHLNKAYRRPKGSLNALASTSQALSAPLGCHIPSLFFWPDWPDVYSCAHSPLAKLLLCIEPAPHSFISTVAPSGLRSLPLPSSTPLPLPTATYPSAVLVQGDLGAPALSSPLYSQVPTILFLASCGLNRRVCSSASPLFDIMLLSFGEPLLGFAYSLVPRPHTATTATTPPAYPANTLSAPFRSKPFGVARRHLPACFPPDTSLGVPAA
jgi:hypothetical protein